MSTDYFSCSGGPSVVCKKRARTCFTEVVFLHLVGYAAHVMHFGASGARNIDTLFFMLWWDRYDFHKKRAGTRYFELAFLHLIGSVGHVVHSGAPERET
jgi:hypothetical protein